MILLLAAALCASCGSQVIEGRPPFVGIAAMSLSGDTLTTDFRIANQNGVAMTIDTVDITVSVDGSELTRENRPLQLAIDANSAEEIHVETLLQKPLRGRLEALSNHEVDSLSFDLAGRVHTEENGTLRFEHKGYFYPVPGRPGQFRSAVTQAQGLRRDDRL